MPMSATEIDAQVVRDLGPGHAAIKMGRLWLVMKLAPPGSDRARDPHTHDGRGGTLARAITDFKTKAAS